MSIPVLCAGHSMGIAKGGSTHEPVISPDLQECCVEWERQLHRVLKKGFGAIGRGHSRAVYLCLECGSIAGA